MKRMIYFLIAFSTISCKKEFKPDNFKGVWTNLTENNSSNELPSITFRNDSIYLEDIYTYTVKGKFELSRNKIMYYLKNDTLTYEFSFNSNDSTILINNHKYRFWEGYSYDETMTNYDLIGVTNLGSITTDSLYRFDGGFHLFKNKQDSTKLKLNEKITSNFNEIKRFDFDIHFDLPITVIYIGKNISLKDLIKCYLVFGSFGNKRSSLLITNYNPKTNSYNGIIDRFDFWKEQITPILKKENAPSLPFLDEDSKNIYFKRYKPKNIIINSKDDFHFLNVSENNNLLISINPNLELEDYLTLKQQIQVLKKEKKIKIRTEFKYLPNL